MFEVFTPLFVYRLTLGVLTSLVLLTLASQFGQYLYLELTTHFRAQYIIAAVLCAVVLTVFQGWKFVPIALLCAALNLVYLLPYYRGGVPAKNPEHLTRLKILHANVLKSNKQYEKVLELIKRTNADVVVLQEVTEEWTSQTTALEQLYPHFVFEPRPSGAGMAVFSRYPFLETRTLTLDESTHLAILAQVSIEGKLATILALHPTTPITPKKFKDRNRQYREAAKLVKNLEGPKVIIGDLNTTMWSPYFIDLVRNSGLRDARLGFGLRPSWPTFLPEFLRMPIDHCLVSEDVSVDNIDIGGPTGSDHRPLIVSLSMN